MTRDETWLLKEKYQGEKTEGFFTDCERLRDGEPIAYVIGNVPFLNTTIHLDTCPLIPRPETEFWVSKLIAEIEQYPTRSNLVILDLCAGSGCIGVAMLKAIPSARVDFVEIDPRHHPTILKNIRENDVDESRTHVFGGNLFERVAKKYDYILTNPPYVDPALNRVEESVTKFEPEIALYGGEQGVKIITDIITGASNFLTRDGILVIEHEPEQVEAVCVKASEAGFDASTCSDQFNVPRYTRLIRKN